MQRQHAPSRFILSLFLGLTIFGSQAATPPGNPLNLVPEKITDKVYLVQGSFELPNEKNHGFRNNCVVVLTSAGPVLLDPGGSAWSGEMIVELIKPISTKPVVAIFNSHAHGDHWLGNEGVKRHYPDAIIYTHPRMKDRLEHADGIMWLEQIEKVTKGAAGGKKVIIPDKTVNDGDVIKIGDTRFRIYHSGAAHTDNDIMVEVIEESVLFTGDVVRNGLLGIMESDASFSGNISTIDFIAEKKFSHYIPGHGPAGGIEVLAGYRDYLDQLLGKVRSLYSEGLTDYEMKPEVIKVVASFKQWAGFDMRVGSHVSRAYLEVEAEEFQ